MEILHRQLESEERDYLQRLKRRAFELGLSLYNLSIHQDFVWAEPEERQRHVDHTLHCIDLAHEMGIPSIRVNSGGWRKEGSFDDLIQARGWVEPWPDHTQGRRVRLGLRLHWPMPGPRRGNRASCCSWRTTGALTTFADGVLRILNTVNSPWLGGILDMGNYLFEDDMYAAMEKVAPYINVAHMKTYPGGGSWYSLDLDYARVFRILLEAGFSGLRLH